MVEFSADAARTWLGLLSTLGVEHGAAAVTPAKINARLLVVLENISAV